MDIITKNSRNNTLHSKTFEGYKKYALFFGWKVQTHDYHIKSLTYFTCTMEEIVVRWQGTPEQKIKVKT